MKEPDYNIKLMSTYGGVIVNNGQKDPKKKYTDNNGSMKTTTFKHTEPFSNYFL